MSNPKVLVVGINPWIDNTGINTLINFFCGWGKDSLAHIYTRDGCPHTVICNNFFQISESKLIRSVLKKGIKAGAVVENEEPHQGSKSRLYNRKHGNLMSLAREMVWLLGKWKTGELNQFLDAFSPDILFFPVYSTVYMNRLQNYIADYTKKPVVLYSSDDNYSYKSVNKDPLSLLMRAWVRKHEKKLIRRATKIMVISQMQKEEYDRLFQTDCTVMTKGIDFESNEYHVSEIHAPVKMVYTGKLIIGRWKSLAEIAKALGEVNNESLKIQLDIYTTDPVDSKQDALLNRNGCSVKGALSLAEVEKVQKEADVLVFAESLEKKYRYRARLSFSTKITDYLRAGKCILAIGDKNIAPIDYFIRNDAAMTATSAAEIEISLQKIANDPDAVREYGRKAYECGVKNHDRNKLDFEFRQVMLSVAEKNIQG